MNGAEHREVVIVGAGLLGLAAAYVLGERGRDVVCLEQDDVGSERSGSRGTSRIFRLGYDDPLYVAMAARAEHDWRSLEAACAEQLLDPCDVLNFGEGLGELMSARDLAGRSPELMAPDEVASRYPRLAIAGPAVLDPSGGILRADRALAGFRSVMRAELRERVTVTGLDDDGSTTRVSTSAGPLEAGVVVVCAGAGSRQLLRSAGIECRTVATSEQVAYFSLASDGREAQSGDVAPLPAVIERRRIGSGVSTGPHEASGWAARPLPGESLHGPGRADQLALYGLPSPGPDCYKIGVHHTGPEVDPRAPAPAPDDAFTERLVQAARSVLRDIDPVPRLVERCVYDNTADEHFVIDRIGRIVIGAGTSGHGFKFGPLLGSLLADLATGSRPTVALERFSARRPAVAGS
jgi:sarcosine oxidase